MDSDFVFIWSGEHDAYWRHDGQGYTKTVSDAGMYKKDDASKRIEGCGPEKQLRIVTPDEADRHEVYKRHGALIDENAKLRTQLAEAAQEHELNQRVTDIEQHLDIIKDEDADLERVIFELETALRDAVGNLKIARQEVREGLETDVYFENEIVDGVLDALAKALEGQPVSEDAVSDENSASLRGAVMRDPNFKPVSEWKKVSERLPGEDDYLHNELEIAWRVTPDPILGPSHGWAREIIRNNIGAWHILPPRAEFYRTPAPLPNEQENVDIQSDPMRFIDQAENETWPRYIEGPVRRIADMHHDSALTLVRDASGDVCLSVVEYAETGGARIAGVEFCTVGSGGGKSPKTFKALCALMVAMEEDGNEFGKTRLTPLPNEQEPGE